MNNFVLIMKLLFAIVLLSVYSSFVLCEVTVLKQVQVIYDTSPKIRIRGSGFDANDHDIMLDVGATGKPPLVVDKDFIITKDVDGDGIIMKLLSNRKWADLSGRVPPVSMVLSAVKFRSDPDTNLLVEPVFVAEVLATPGIIESDWVLYQSASNELCINGTGFTGAKKVDLYFQPPLNKGVAYEDVTPYPITKNRLVLRLRHGYNWRDEVGPLMVIGVDTGGGAVKTVGHAGVQVADVEADMDEHSVTVEDTACTQLVYNDDSTIVVHGTGFSEVGNLLRWANGLLGNNVNYTTVSTTSTAITLKLTAQSHWRKNVENLPGVLNLLAVNVGGGYVAVDPTNSGKGRDVATVFERPAVYQQDVQLFRMQSRTLRILGTGFSTPSTGYYTHLRFNTPIMEGVHYTLATVDRTAIVLTLQDNAAWRDGAGPLVVTEINTRGDEGGWVTLPGGGVVVAQVQMDGPDPPADPAPLTVEQLNVKVYQSALQKSIIIQGTGFAADAVVTLEPPLTVGVDYIIEYTQIGKLQLKLWPGKQWRASAGPLLLKHISAGGKNKTIGGELGLQIAWILADPYISPSAVSVHNTQTKVITIYGRGFTNVPDSQLHMQPGAPNAFKVTAALMDKMKIQLNPQKAWLPSFMSPNEESRIPLQIYSIDTGAGDVVFDTPVTIGYIVKDREGAVCDDSCEFAFDGLCDDRQQTAYFVQNQPPYQDPAPCQDFTDCTDCGGVDHVFQPPPPADGGGGNDNLPPPEPPTTISLEDTSLTQRVYDNTRSIVISGVVPGAAGQFLRWSNALLDNKVQYEIDSLRRTITARLPPRTTWIERGHSLPAELSVVGVIQGGASGKATAVNVPIATVVEVPTVFDNCAPMRATQTRELHIQGAHFPSHAGAYPISLQFSPPLQEGANGDYTFRMVSQTELALTLREGRAWRSTPGRLLVTAVNTLGSPEGWVPQGDAGACVAAVHPDPTDKQPAQSPVVQLAVGVLVVGILIPIVVLIFCLTSAAFRRRDSIPPVALNAKEFEMTPSAPMVVTATDVILSPIHAETDSDPSAAYMLVPEQYEDV